MKTFTTYAAKAKQFLNLLQGYTKGIRITAILILLLMGVSNAWGASYPLTVNYPYVYLDNSSLKWDGCNVVVGHDSYSYGYLMTKIENTNLFYKEIPANWGDAKGIVFVKGTDEWGEWKNESLYNRTNNKTRTGYKWDNEYESMDYHKTYLCTSTGSNDLIISYQSSGYSALNSQQTIKSAVNGADANSKATISITSYKMTGNGQVTEQTATLGTGAQDTYVSAARTATTTLKVGDVATGYQFDGWYAAKTGGTALSTEKTYTYYPTAATTVYARFSIKKHTVLFGVHSSGHGSLTAKVGNTDISSNSKVNYGSTIVFTATPSAGYQIEGWYSNSDCTNPINNGTNNTYTVTITGGTNVYVKYEEIPEEKFAVTIQPNNANYGTVSPSGLQQVGASGIDITATAKTGYQFDEWTCTIGASVEDASKPNTTASATAESTVTANFSIKNYTITYHLHGGTNNTSNPASYTVETETITLQDPTKEGFLFAGWYTSSTFNGTAVTSITKGSTGNKTYYAKWIDSRDCIFFYNNLGWENVYVYFYSSDKYWDDSKGTGSKKEQTFPQDGDADHKPHYLEYRGKMTKIEGTNIWYYNRTVHGDINRDNYTTVAFTKDQQYNYEFFHKTEVVRRSDYNSSLPMFVSMKADGAKKNESTYYNNGYWMNYPTNTGYELHIWDANGNTISDQLANMPFEFSENIAMPLSINVRLEAATTYSFKFERADGQWFGNNGKMTTGHSGDAGQTAWEFTTGTNNCKITTTAAGIYVFTLKYGKDANKNYNYLLGVEYPASVGDYRLVYQDNTHPFHPGHLLKKRDGKDTVSFFVHHNLSPVIMLQKVTNINANTGAITWGNLKTYALTANQPVGDNPGQAMISGRRNADEVILHIGDEHMDGVDSTGIYNFVLEQTASEAALQDVATKYTGNFYIRTNAAAGGWVDFRQKSNQITYSSFADKHSNFNHYYCKYIEEGSNVKFTIANDYSYCISDTLDNDAIIQPNQSSDGCLPVKANVRFGWDSNTNEISRAYIKGAGMTSDRFLVLQGKDNNLKDANGNTIPKGTGTRAGLLAHEEILVDQQNWIYQVDVTANKNTKVKLVADYNGTTQYFKGNAEEYTQLLSSSASKDYKIRLIYDFKSNHLVTAWLVGGDTIKDKQVLGADMMVIRTNQDTAAQLNFNPLSSPLDSVGTGYAVMTFTSDWINGTAEARERSLYWVSFPFDVKISDVFGFGEYAEHWILQYYDGAERAEKGLFSDSGTYWKYIFDTDTKLKAGEGYVLVLDLNKIEFLHGATEVSLYFPSTNPLTMISGELPTADTIPAHECTIDREWTEGERTYHHKYTDSHWNLIGVPGFADIKDFDVTAYHFTQYTPDVSFYYAFDLKNSTYTVADAATNFQAMYAYMVQFAGTINWVSKTVTGVEPQPKELAARRNSNSDEPERVVLRLELAQGEEVADRTFVQLQQEGATANFDLSLDLTKIVNIGVSNIYTLTDSLKIQTAGNVLPFEETTVAVGVDIATAGEYTFRMPDGTEGMVVELIDYETNTTTNLLLDNYTVNLPAGSNETRFALSIKPEKTATSIESTTTPSDSNIRKFIIDGKLYLQKDGMLYDAQGHIVR